MSIHLEIISPLILIFLGIHFLIFITPPLRKKLSKKYIKRFNLFLLWAVSLFIMSGVLAKIGEFELISDELYIHYEQNEYIVGEFNSLPDQVPINWAQSRQRYGFIFNFLDIYSNGEFRAHYSIRYVKIIPLLANLLIFFTPLALATQRLLKKCKIKLNTLKFSFVLIFIAIGLLFLNIDVIFSSWMGIQLI